jgi:hypothetical protein
MQLEAAVARNSSGPSIPASSGARASSVCSRMEVGYASHTYSRRRIQARVAQPQTGGR